jgi:hypothetical protein
MNGRVRFRFAPNSRPSEYGCLALPIRTIADFAVTVDLTVVATRGPVPPSSRNRLRMSSRIGFNSRRISRSTAVFRSFSAADAAAIVSSRPCTDNPPTMRRATIRGCCQR